MTRYSFLNDYSEGCHPAILEALVGSNLVQQSAYGDDQYSILARKLIGQQLGKETPPIFFVAGGTLANLIIATTSLRSHEAIIAASSAHIVVHETGAIEATGHKIISVPSADGKLTPADIETSLAANSHFPHMAKPRLVYISNATEVGTVYTKAQLQGLSAVCRANELLLMMDGARLGAALTAEINDLTLKDIAELTDIFWIGGTKAGALIGEAIVIPNPQLALDFAFHIKQRGALLAKGRLLGIQFVELFSNNLFFDLTRHGNSMAQKLSTAITDCGYGLSAPTESNQIFPILPDTLIDRLKESYDFYVWGKRDNNHSVIRLVTCWATDEKQVAALIDDIKTRSTQAAIK
ncbi:MAG: threonine aldolase [Planctomycetota bacterium]